MLKKLLLFISLIFICPNAYAATTWYACSGGGNWNGASVWTSILADEIGCTASTGNPVAGDTAILNSNSGNITITASAAAAILDETGYAGTLAFGSQSLSLTGASSIGGAMTATTGNLVSSSSITLLNTPTGTFPKLTITGTNTFTSGGFSWPGVLAYAGTSTFNLVGNLNVGSLLFGNSSGGAGTFSGAYNISCGTLGWNTNTLSYTVNFVSGQTIAVTNSLKLTLGQGGTSVIKSTVSSSSAFLNYTGTSANSDVANFTFTDIDASGSTSTIYNYNGGALTRTKNIVNVTQANIGGVFIQ